MTLTIQNAVTMLEARGSRIAFLSETGSRAWGTDGPTSDHDLLAVTIQPISDYAALMPPEASMKIVDTPEMSLVFFDVRQALTMTANGNPYFGERCKTLVHESIPEIRDAFQAYAERCFDGYSALRCWGKEGKAVFQERIDRSDSVEQRRYVNLLRPSFAINRYLSGTPGLPPANILELASEVDVPADISDFLENAVQRCKAGAGREAVSRLPFVERYWEESFRAVASAKDVERQIPDWNEKMDEGTRLVLQWTSAPAGPEVVPASM